MGIPGLFGRWLERRKFKGVINNQSPGRVSSLSIDLNSIFHETAQVVYAYGGGVDQNRLRYIRNLTPEALAIEHFIAIETKIMELVMAVRPRDTLVLAVDGVAPMAKISQQRSRRFMSSRVCVSKFFDSNSITPGTEYMKKLDQHLQYWIETNRLKYPLPTKIIYSPWNSPGEGEHKIMDYFRNGQVSSINEVGDLMGETEGVHIVHGADTDMIMLCSLLPIPHIYWRRGRQYIDIDNFRQTLYSNMGNKDYNVNDFVVMMFLIGNDFLPKSPALADYSVSIDTMINIYAQLNTGENEFPLTNLDGSISWLNLGYFLQYLSQVEPDLIQARLDEIFLFGFEALEYASERSSYVLTTGSTKGKQENVTFNMSKFRDSWYHHEFRVMPTKFGTQDSDETAQLLDKMLGPDYPLYGVENIDDMCKQYLRGIAWTYSYYINGTSGVNPEWYYNFYHTPLLVDVYQYLAENLDTELDGDNFATGWEPNPNAELLNPVHQLLAVLPRTSRKLIPREVLSLTTIRSPIADYYPEDFIIDQDGITKEHEAFPILPFVNPDRIRSAVSNFATFTPSRTKEFTPVEDIISTRTEDTNEIIQSKRDLRAVIRGRGRPQQQGSYVTFYEERPSYRGTRGRGRGSGSFRGRGDMTRGTTGRDVESFRGGGFGGRGFRGGSDMTRGTTRGTATRGTTARGTATRGTARGTTRGTTRGTATRGSVRGRGGGSVRGTGKSQIITITEKPIIFKD